MPLCQSFRKFRSEFKWKGPFRFLPTGIFGITSGGGPLISVGIFRSKFAVPFLTNRFFALIREFGNVKKKGKSYSDWLARFNRKMSFHFPWVVPLISYRSVWHNGKQPKDLPYTFQLLLQCTFMGYESTLRAWHACCSFICLRKIVLKELISSLII